MNASRSLSRNNSQTGTAGPILAPSPYSNSVAANFPSSIYPWYNNSTTDSTFSGVTYYPGAPIAARSLSVANPSYDIPVTNSVAPILSPDYNTSKTANQAPVPNFSRINSTIAQCPSSQDPVPSPYYISCITASYPRGPAQMVSPQCSSPMTASPATTANTYYNTSINSVSASVVDQQMTPHPVVAMPALMSRLRLCISVTSGRVIVSRSQVPSKFDGS